jgi:hypothetical protein
VNKLWFKAGENNNLTTAPTPKTATVEFVSTLQVFQTAPRPVETPQPKRQAFLRSALELILAQEISATTVYSLMVLHLLVMVVMMSSMLAWMMMIMKKGYVDLKQDGVREGSTHCCIFKINSGRILSTYPMKWKISFPSLSLNLEVPSGMTPAP